MPEEEEPCDSPPNPNAIVKRIEELMQEAKRLREKSDALTRRAEALRRQSSKDGVDHGQ